MFREKTKDTNPQARAAEIIDFFNHCLKKINDNAKDNTNLIAIIEETSKGMVSIEKQIDAASKSLEESRKDIADKFKVLSDTFKAVSQKVGQAGIVLPFSDNVSVPQEKDIATAFTPK